MIRIERDRQFWLDVASHPAVAGSVMGLDAQAVADHAQDPRILPLASEHGGFLFCQLDGLGFVRELHTLYMPQGWGREVLQAAKEAFTVVFEIAQIVTTYEMRANHRSQPPRSFGFVAAGDWQTSIVGDLRAWVLTREAWQQSPAHRRHLCHLSRH